MTDTPPTPPTPETPATPPAAAPAAPSGPSPVLSIISLVAGIIGVLGSGIVAIPIVGSILGLIIPAAAVILGFLGKKREPFASKGLWMTGIILGFVGIGIALIALIVWIGALATSGITTTVS
ncbi:MAG: DUF4190 domain-containing protein [Microbacteriaceae bacterium]|nr:DUF4190 domain-containing protein [Microbacteriaceae bacterium]